MTLDLKSESGKKVLYRMISDVDVVMEGFRPGQVQSMDIGPESLIELNNDLIYCSISGYGQDGPYRERAGHDLNYAGYAGLLDMTRSEPDKKPAIPGVPITDLAAGVHAAYQVVSALLGRELGNSFDNHIDVSMTEAALSFTQIVNSEAFTGENPRPGETALTGEFPCYGIYPTRDDKYVTLSCLEPKFWSNFCEAVDREEWIDRHLSDDESTKERLRSDLKELFRTKTRDEWEEKLGDKDVMVGSVYEPEEVLEDDHFNARGIINRDEFRVDLKNRSSIKERDWPAKGEHTESVLRSFGFDQDHIHTLEEEDVI